jgi:AraC-like DNA-binding protein
LTQAFGTMQDPTPFTHVPHDRDSQVRAVAPQQHPALNGPNGLPTIVKVPETLKERLSLARERLRHAGEHGLRIRVYEVALDLDMSEFHFARQFRAAYGCSPHVYYDEVRAARGRDLLAEGSSQGQTARRIGLRRPAELRALLAKRQSIPSMSEVEYFAVAAS